MIKKYPALKNLVSLFFLLYTVSVFSQTQTFTTPGTYTFTVPAGVTQVTVEAWGAGGGGGSVGNGYVGGAGGGGGGAYASSLITVTPGNSYLVVVGLGGATNINGTNSTFDTSIVKAEGGLAGNGNTSSAGIGGRIENSTGTTKYGGGSGANGYNVYTPVEDYNSGGGGGGAGSAGNGGNALGTTAGTGTATNGGSGGAGKKIHGEGNSGNPYGGGGGGAVRTTSNSQNGGSGGNGMVIITWTCPTYSLSSISITTPLCLGNSATVTFTAAAAGLPIGTYTVIYNQSAPNLLAGETITMSVTTAGTGSFIIPSNKLTSSGATTITITNLSSGSGTSKCSSVVNNTTTVTVTPNMTVTASTPQTRCINNTLTNITHTTTGVTGINAPTGLPAGVTASWAANVITISGTPTVSGTFNYSVPLTGGCGTMNATGTITVTAAWSANAGPNVTSCTVANLTGGTTGVLPSTSSTILSENFNTGGLPSGWVRTNNGTTGYTDFPNTSEFASSGNTWCADKTLGKDCIGRAMYFYSYIVPINIPGCLETPAMDLTLHTSASLTFFIYNSSGTDNLKVYAKQGAGTYSQIGSTYTTYSSWTQITISLNSLVGGSNNAVKIKFEGISDYGASNIGIDDVLITGSLPSPTYSWTGPGGFTSSSQNPSVTTTGTYTLTVAAGTCISTSQVVATINPNNTVTTASSTPTLCINIALTNIIHTTTGAIGIGGPTGLPAGVTSAWAGNTITISGTPTASGTFNYIIPLTGGCGSVNATGTITVTANTTTAGIVTAGTTPQCIGATTTYTVSGQVLGGGTGAWTSSNTAVATVNSSTGLVTAVGAGTCNIVYTVTGGCNGTSTASQSYTVRPPVPANPETITVTAAQCPSLTSQVYSISNVPDATTYNWAVPSGWSITAGLGTTSITVSTGSAGQNGNITVSAQNSCGTSSVQTLAVMGNTINYWNGSANTTNWNNTANWSTGIPSDLNKLDIVIPVVLSGKYPLLSDDISINNIEIQNGALLNVLNNGLTITGDLILNGKIDLQGESQLIQEMTSSLIICNNSSGTIEIDQQGTGNSFRYNYWSSPVNSNLTRDKYTIGVVLKNGTNPVTPITFGASHTFAEQNIDSSPIQLSTYWMYVLRNSGAGYAAWFRVGSTGEVSVGEGYTMKGSNTSAALQNYTFMGKPNNGDITLTLNGGFDYLLGNPYPSAINAAKFLLNNPNTTGTIYFWEHYGGDTHNLAGYQAGYATRNSFAGVPATTAVGVSSLIPPGLVKKIPGPYIAVGQSFFVVGGLANGQIKFNNGQRIFVKESQLDTNDNPISVFMKTSITNAKNTDSNLEDLRPKYRIGFDAPKINHRQLLIGVDECATNGIDWGFDAEIYEIFADDMYWMREGKKYVIQATNAIGLNSEVPLGIQLSKTGVVTVKIDALENVDDDTSIYLKDKLTGESYNMREKPVQLNLTAGKYADRFALTFKTQKLVTEDVVAEVLIPAAAQTIIEGIHVYMNNAIGELQIKNNSTEEITSVALLNTLGQTVKTWNSNFNIRTISLPLSTATGVYLVQINTKTGKTVKKISVE